MRSLIIKFNPLLKWTLKRDELEKKQCAAKCFTQAGICNSGLLRHVRQFLKMRDIRAEMVVGVSPKVVK
jgi:hypothetical protein